MSPGGAETTSIPDSFWDHLARAAAALLLLDYDGTLAPFRVERDRAEPYPGVRDRLARLLESGHTRLVILSGRPSAEVDRLLGIYPPPEIWGMHGFERRLPEGRVEIGEVGREARTLLDRAERTGEALLSPKRVERKPAGVAFHWRGMSDEEVEASRRELERYLSDLVAESPLEVLPFDGGLEVRPRGVDKGQAIERLLGEVGQGAAIAYLGDDRTDEDAFRALGSRGLSVLVRNVPRPTAARVRLGAPEGLLLFLDRWFEIREGGQHA